MFYEYNRIYDKLSTYYFKVYLFNYWSIYICTHEARIHVRRVETSFSCTYAARRHITSRCGLTFRGNQLVVERKGKRMKNHRPVANASACVHTYVYSYSDAPSGSDSKRKKHFFFLARGEI